MKKIAALLIIIAMFALKAHTADSSERSKPTAKEIHKKLCREAATKHFDTITEEYCLENTKYKYNKEERTLEIELLACSAGVLATLAYHYEDQTISYGDTGAQDMCSEDAVCDELASKAVDTCEIKVCGEAEADGVSCSDVQDDVLNCQEEEYLLLLEDYNKSTDSELVCR